MFQSWGQRVEWMKTLRQFFCSGILFTIVQMLSVKIVRIWNMILKLICRVLLTHLSYAVLSNTKLQDVTLFCSSSSCTNLRRHNNISDCPNQNSAPQVAVTVCTLVHFIFSRLTSDLLSFYYIFFRPVQAVASHSLWRDFSILTLIWLLPQSLTTQRYMVAFIF